MTSSAQGTSVKSDVIGENRNVIDGLLIGDALIYISPMTGAEVLWSDPNIGPLKMCRQKDNNIWLGA